jgi:hypothetical protein
VKGSTTMERPGTGAGPSGVGAGRKAVQSPAARRSVAATPASASQFRRKFHRRSGPGTAKDRSIPPSAATASASSA